MPAEFDDSLPKASQSEQGESLSMRLWRLYDELSLTEAALLLIGQDPQEHSDVDRLPPDETPTGYEAAIGLIERAFKRGEIEGDAAHNNEGTEFADLSRVASRVTVRSLARWLDDRGFIGFFTPHARSLEPYLDPEEPRYAPKLAAALTAWKSVSEAGFAKKSVKQQLTEWLERHADQFELRKIDGTLKTTTINYIAMVANWEDEGGAPRSHERSD